MGQDAVPELGLRSRDDLVDLRQFLYVSGPDHQRIVKELYGADLQHVEDDLSAGQRSDYIGARALLRDLPDAKHMLADRGNDADWYREALEEREITPCIPSRKGRKVPIPHDADRYKKRHKIENSFARLKDWRRVATRYDRCPKVFLSACALAAVVMFWL